MRKKKLNHKPSTSAIVRNFVVRYPSVLDCLRKGIINHSRLAGIIKRENPRLKTSALIAAVRRLAIRSVGKASSDAGLDRVFKHSRLTAQGGVALVICSSLDDISQIINLKKQAQDQEETFLFMEGLAKFTLVISQTYLGPVKKIFRQKIKASYENLALLSVSLPYTSVHTAGVSARLTGLLAANGIPILQEMTSGGEYFMVLEMKHLASGIETLEARRSLS